MSETKTGTSLLLTLAFFMMPAPVSGQERSAFENAMIVNPANETVTHGTILVRDGRIESVVTTLPAGFTGSRTDLGGRYVLPGLVDMHTHSFGNMSPAGAPQMLGTPGVARVNLYAGVIAFLDLFNMEDVILQFRDRQRDGGQPGAAVFAAGPCLTATGGHCSEYGIPTRIVNTPEDARREVSALAPKRPDVVKIVYDNQSYGGRQMPTVNKETLAAVVATAREHGLKTVVHIGTWNDVRDAVEAGAAAVTHTPGPDAPPPGLAAMMVEAGTYHIPTLAVQGDLSRILRDPSMLDDPLLAGVTTEALRDSYRPAGGLEGRAAGFAQWQNSLIASNLAAVRQLSAAGVPMLTGTDGGNFGVFQGYSVHRELELLVEAGLTPWEALRAGTTNASRFLNQSWGVEPGNEATFIVLDGAPHEDVRNTRRIHQVVQRGVPVDRSAAPVR